MLRLPLAEGQPQVLLYVDGPVLLFYLFTVLQDVYFCVPETSLASEVDNAAAISEIFFLLLCLG